MGEVIKFVPKYRPRINAVKVDECMERALEAGLESVFIFGFDKNGELFVETSEPLTESILMLESFNKTVLSALKSYESPPGLRSPA